MELVLASQSKFRKQALDLLDLDYEAIPSEVDEKSIRDEDPKRLAIKLAEAKAKNVAQDLSGEKLIIAGDLLVLFQGEIYEKPETEREAHEMLNAFSGDKVKILSSVSVFNTKTDCLNSELGESRIKFRQLNQREIENYISSYPVCDFAGAFEKEFILKFSEEVRGGLSFLTGFSVNKLVKLLRQKGIEL